jgi:putative membrane protein
MGDKSQEAKTGGAGETAAKRAEPAAKMDKTTELAAQRTDLAADRTDMALARTVMAADRTLMSWVRTGLSLMGFGFTIYKFLTYLGEFAITTGVQPENPAGATTLGVIMVGMGTLCMVLGLIEYRSMFRRYGSPLKRSLWGTAFIIGILTAVFGLTMLFSLITKIPYF